MAIRDRYPTVRKAGRFSWEYENYAAFKAALAADSKLTSPICTAYIAEGKASNCNKTFEDVYAEQYKCDCQYTAEYREWLAARKDEIMNLYTISKAPLSDVIERCITKRGYRAALAIAPSSNKVPAELDKEIKPLYPNMIEKTTIQKQSLKYDFVNGSTFEIFIADSKFQCCGKRLHEIHIDPKIDQKTIFSVLLPMQCSTWRPPIDKE